MKKIDIDEEVYQALLKLVKSFEDTPNDVLRRLLGLGEIHKEQQEPEMVIKDYEQPVKEMVSSLGLEKTSISKITRVRGATPQKKYRIPILEALIKKGGKATQQEVFEIIEIKMGNSFNELDLEFLKDGYTKRWQKNVAFARFRMSKEGLLKHDSPRSIWEISEKGRKYFENKS